MKFTLTTASAAATIHALSSVASAAATPSDLIQPLLNTTKTANISNAVFTDLPILSVPSLNTTTTHITATKNISKAIFTALPILSIPTTLVTATIPANTTTATTMPAPHVHVQADAKSDWEELPAGMSMGKCMDTLHECGKKKAGVCWLVPVLKMCKNCVC